MVSYLALFWAEKYYTSVDEQPFFSKTIKPIIYICNALAYVGQYRKVNLSLIFKGLYLYIYIYIYVIVISASVEWSDATKSPCLLIYYSHLLIFFHHIYPAVALASHIT